MNLIDMKLLDEFTKFYKKYMEFNKERILERDLPERPSWEELTSDSYANDVLHDMISDVLYDGIVKGRQWE